MMGSKAVPEHLFRLGGGAAHLTHPDLLTPVSVVLVEGRPPGWVYRNKLRLLVVGTSTPRPSTNVFVRAERFVHTDYDGVTTGSVALNAWSSSARPWISPTDVPALKFSVMNLTSDTVSIGRAATGPKTRHLSVMRVVDMGGNTFHGGGMYPGDHLLSPPPFFLLPPVKHDDRGGRGSGR